MGVYADVWPVFFRRHGATLAEIGWLSGLSIAWSLKVLLVAARSTASASGGAGSPRASRDGRLPARRSPARIADGVGALAWLAIGLFCLASATQDIAIDAYTIGLVERGREGPANSVRITAYRVGLIAAGGMLLLPRWIGWSGAFARRGARLRAAGGRGARLPARRGARGGAARARPRAAPLDPARGRRLGARRSCCSTGSAIARWGRW